MKHTQAEHSVLDYILAIIIGVCLTVGALAYFDVLVK